MKNSWIVHKTITSLEHTREQTLLEKLYCDHETSCLDWWKISSQLIATKKREVSTPGVVKILRHLCSASSSERSLQLLLIILSCSPVRLLFSYFTQYCQLWWWLCTLNTTIEASQWQKLIFLRCTTLPSTQRLCRFLGESVKDFISSLVTR